MKDGNGVQQWVKPLRMHFYGLATNDSWCEILIPLKRFDRIDFSRVQQYFMWTADTTMGYTTNRTYYLDDIYFTNGYGGALDNYTETNFGIYSERVEQTINMNYDTELSIWTNDGGGMILSDDAADFSEGTRAWKMTGTGAWMGFGIYAWPGNAWTDMSAYADGVFRFSYKGTRPVAKIGAQSRNADNSLRDALANAYDLMTYFGLKTNNTWSDVAIPVRYLIWKGLDISRVFHYFIFAQDASAGYTAGDECRVDNIYWTKTPGGNMNWTTNTNNTGFGLYSETVPLGVTWDVDMKMYVWTAWGGGMTVQEVFGGAGEAFNSWKLTGTGAWMGMGLTVYPVNTVKNMTAFAGGHLNFMFKGGKRFNKIGVGSEPCGNTHAWFTPEELAAYGLRLDNTWCRVRIPISAVTAKGVKLTEIQSYFQFVHDSASDYAVGDTFWLDNIYWSRD